MSIYKLSGAGTGGAENGIAQLDVQFDGIITAVHGSITAALDANQEFAIAEASFISTSSINSNDTRGSIFTIRSQIGLVTSGMAKTAENASVGGLAIVVNAGERLWLHLNVSASTVATAEIYLYVEDGQGVPTSTRRR